MKITVTAKQKIRSSIVRYLSIHGEATRAELIHGAVALCGLTAEEMANRSATGKYNVVRSYAGVALGDLTANGDLKETNGTYTLIKEELVIVREDQCEKQIRRLLSGSSLTKNDLFRQLDAKFGTSKTASPKDDAVLRSLAGTVLRRLEDRGEIICENGLYSRSDPASAATDAPLDREAFKKRFFARLYPMGGEFFEQFALNLLERYYRMTNRTILKCEVTGGSADGGIDGLIDTVDYLGFRENIMIQTKCRRTAHVTETEIRAFYGAVCAMNGSRGIFVTTSVFHIGAKNLLATIENCVGIDGDKLFDLAVLTAFGIHKSADGYRFDESAFLK